MIGFNMRHLMILCLVMLMGCSNMVKAHWTGALISDKYQIDELAKVSTAFAYSPTSAEDLLDILKYNNGRLVPVIELSKYFWDEIKGLFVYKDLSDILQGTHIVVYLDEPMWRIRRACAAGNHVSCQEINNKFASTQEVFTRIKENNSYEILHIEAYLELIKQKQQFNRVFMLDAADHVGFDCYGSIDNCEGHSQWEYGNWVYETIVGTNKKMFLTVGAWHFASIDVVINQINQYFDIYKSNLNLFSGIGVFTWGDFDGIIGAREIPELSAIVKQKLHENK